MGKKTNYKRLWRKEKKEGNALHDKLQDLKRINEAQIDVLRRVRDGELKPDEIFGDEKISDDVRFIEDLKERKKVK